jgi:hypothetical protein
VTCYVLSTVHHVVSAAWITVCVSLLAPPYITLGLYSSPSKRHSLTHCNKSKLSRTPVPQYLVLIYVCRIFKYAVPHG